MRHVLQNRYTLMQTTANDESRQITGSLPRRVVSQYFQTLVGSAYSVDIVRLWAGACESMFPLRDALTYSRHELALRWSPPTAT